jgi:hypothetical protein
MKLLHRYDLNKNPYVRKKPLSLDTTVSSFPFRHHAIEGCSIFGQLFFCIRMILKPTIILEIDAIQKIESKKMESKTGLIVTFRVCKDKVNLSG